MRPNRATLIEKPHPPTKMGYACHIFQPISLKHALHFALLKITLTLEKEQWQKPAHAVKMLSLQPSPPAFSFFKGRNNLYL